MAFTDEEIQKVWEKGRPVEGNNPAHFRKDQCGAWMRRDLHGSRDHEYGWEVDHIIPIERGGTDNIINLRPLQWKNNASKQDGNLTCPVTAQGVDNIG